MNIIKLCISLANRILFSIFPRVFFASIYNNVQLFNFWLWSGTHTVTQLTLHMAMLVTFLLTGCHVNSHNILCFLVCNDNPMIYRNVYENMGSGMFHFNRGFQVHAAWTTKYIMWFSPGYKAISPQLGRMLPLCGTYTLFLETLLRTRVTSDSWSLFYSKFQLLLSS